MSYLQYLRGEGPSLSFIERRMIEREGTPLNAPLTEVELFRRKYPGLDISKEDYERHRANRHFELNYPERRLSSGGPRVPPKRILSSSGRDINPGDRAAFFRGLPLRRKQLLEERKAAASRATASTGVRKSAPVNPLTAIVEPIKNILGDEKNNNLDKKMVTITYADMPTIDASDSSVSGKTGIIGRQNTIWDSVFTPNGKYEWKLNPGNSASVMSGNDYFKRNDLLNPYSSPFNWQPSQFNRHPYFSPYNNYKPYSTPKRPVSVKACGTAIPGVGYMVVQNGRPIELWVKHRGLFEKYSIVPAALPNGAPEILNSTKRKADWHTKIANIWENQ